MPAIPETLRCKAVHVKMDKETHANFKIRTIQHGLSMQEALAEFARLVGSGNVSANNLLSKMIKQQIREELATVGLKPFRNRKPRRISELDDDGVYDLINGGEEEPDEAELPPHRRGHDEVA